MPFQKGHGPIGGGTKPGISTKAKEKVLAKWMDKFNQDGVSILNDIAKDNKVEFMKLGISMMPKDENLNVNDNRVLTDQEFKEQVEQLNQMLKEDLKGK